MEIFVSQALFCSDECLKEATKKYHAGECMIISQLFNMEPGLNMYHYFLLFIRVLATVGLQNWVTYVHEQATIPPQRIKGYNSKGKLTATSISGLFNLSSTIEHEDGNNISFDCLIIMLYMKFMKLDADDDLLAASLLHLLEGIKCCAVPYTCIIMSEVNIPPNTVLVGTALPITNTLINHSCNPNVCMYYGGNTGFVMRAWVPIKKGEQIFTTYGDPFPYSSKTERQEYLLNGQKFICKCDACENNWPMMANLPIDLKLSQELEIQEERALQQRKFKGTLDNFRQYVSTQMDLETKCKFITKLHGRKKCLTMIYEMQKLLILTLFRIEGNFYHIQ
jgi:hypothetical protein